MTNREHWNGQFMRDGYERTIRANKVGGNCPGSESTLVCVGELHKLPHQIAVGSFIKANAVPGDVVLLEGYPAGYVVRPTEEGRMIYLVPDGVVAKGCEDFSQFLVETTLWNRSLHLRELLKNPSLPRDIADAYIQEQQKLEVELHDSLIKRNAAFMKAVREEQRVLAPGARIYLVAGQAHFEEDPAMAEFLETQKYVMYKTEAPDPFL